MTIRILQAFDKQQFEDWLREGLERILWEPDVGAWVFPGADAAILRCEDLVLGLGDAYRELDARQQGRFRGAVANLMASLEPNAHNGPLFEHLLSLAALLPAPEVLRVLPVRIGGGFFGKVGAEQGRGLFGLAMLTAARLAAPREEALACLHALIGSPNFDTAYSGLALEALTRADSSALAGHLALLRDSLAAMFREFGTDETQKRGIATAILDAAQLPVVLKSWGEILYPDAYDEHVERDAWFPIALLAGDQAPLACERQGDGTLYVYRRTRPTVRGAVPEDGPRFVGLLHLLYDRNLIGRPPISFEHAPRQRKPESAWNTPLSDQEVSLAWRFCIPADPFAGFHPAAHPRSCGVG